MEGIINIVGAMPRIGTTTVALQLVRFLNRNLYHAIYIEMNVTGYLWAITKLYPECKTDRTGKVVYEGIEMYPESYLPALVSGGAHVDYIICDYGNLKSKSLDIQDILNSRAKLLVAGGKANEISYTMKALRDFEKVNAIYLFNFIREEDQEDLMDMMREKKEQTVFIPYMPDPFLGIGSRIDDCFQAVMDQVILQLEEG